MTYVGETCLKHGLAGPASLLPRSRGRAGGRYTKPRIPEPGAPRDTLSPEATVRSRSAMQFFEIPVVSLVSASLLVFVGAALAQEQQPSRAEAAAMSWARFRGDNGSGVAEVGALPLELGADGSRRWRVDVPAGQSSPVLGGGALFLTGADDTALVVLCLDALTGTQRWVRRIERARTQAVHSASGPASPTPTTDGTNVYAFFPEFGLVSFDAGGAERWRAPLGPFENYYGMAASPILAGDTLLWLCDQRKGPYLLALDAATGRERWRTPRGAQLESWTTPVLFPSSAEPRLALVYGSGSVAAYALADGAEVWRQGHVGPSPVCSPVLAPGAAGADPMLVVCAPFLTEDPLPAFEAIAAECDRDGDTRIARAEAKAPVTDFFNWADVDRDDVLTAAEWDEVRDACHSKDFGVVALAIQDGGKRATERWRYRRSLPDIATPLIDAGVVHTLKSGGMLTSLDLASGEERGFLRLAGATGGFYASPIAADGKLYLASTEGVVVVASAGAEPKELAALDLGEPIEATPALGRFDSERGALYVRTKAALYCFAAP